MKAHNSTLNDGKGFQKKGSKMRRTPLRKVGRVGKANIAANRKIKKVVDDAELYDCEINSLNMPEFTDCLHNFAIQNAHRHKRAWYKGDAQLLSRTDQWIRACQNCHDRIEHDKELTEEVFRRLRGDELTTNNNEKLHQKPLGRIINRSAAFRLVHVCRVRFV